MHSMAWFTLGIFVGGPIYFGLLTDNDPMIIAKNQAGRCIGVYQNIDQAKLEAPGAAVYVPIDFIGYKR